MTSTTHTNGVSGPAKHRPAHHINDHPPEEGDCACTCPRAAIADPERCGFCGRWRKAPSPTADDPLAGLELLQQQALVGAAAHEASALKPIAYVWEGAVCPGNVVLLGGAPGEGKTTTLDLLFVARRNRTGKPISVLGCTMNPAPPGKLLVMIQEEHGEVSSARKLLATCAMLDLPPSTLDGVLTLPRRGVKIGSPIWGEVAQLVARGMVDSVWIDSLARVQVGDSNSEEDQAALFAEVQRVLESDPGDVKPCTWMVAHNKKGGTGQGLEEISGSTQRAAQADTIVLFTAERDGGMVVSVTATFVKIRDDNGDWPPPCEFSVRKGDDGRKRVTWSVADAVGRVPLFERIVDFIGRAGPQTCGELRKEFKRNDKAIDDALAVAMKGKSLRRVKKVVGGRSYPAFGPIGASFVDVFDDAEQARAEGRAPPIEARDPTFVRPPSGGRKRRHA